MQQRTVADDEVERLQRDLADARTRVKELGREVAFLRRELYDVRAPTVDADPLHGTAA